jgi:hypothetical protein
VGYVADDDKCRVIKPSAARVGHIPKGTQVSGL